MSKMLSKLVEKNISDIDFYLLLLSLDAETKKDVIKELQSIKKEIQEGKSWTYRMSSDAL